MRLQVTLMLTCLLFPEVRGLKCYECTAALSGICAQTQIDCPDQCSSSTMVSYMGGVNQDMQMKRCRISRECVSGTITLGTINMTINTKCCSTDLCNSQSVPAWSRGSPNGKKCYTCDNNERTGSVNCEGDEDHCITMKNVNANLTWKGCASRSLCTKDLPALMNEHAAGVSVSVNCCQGNLCNGAERVNLSLFLLILGPLLSFSPFSSLPFSVFFR